MQKLENENRVRLSLDITPLARKRLDDLMKRTDATSIAEVIRRSLALLEVCLDYEEEGGSILFRDPDGTDQPLKMILR